MPAATAVLCQPLDTAWEGYRSGDPGYRRVSVALFAAGVATFALLWSTQALLPELARTFAVSAGASALTQSLPTVGLGVALLLTGPLSERIGRTRLVHVSVTASALVGLACALAPTWHALLALRLLQGVALAGLPAVATAYLREELHVSTHARAAGLYIGGTALGGMCGRLVTGGVADLAGWRWGLAATAMLGLACALVVRLVLPSSRRFAPAARVRLAPMLRGALSDPALLALYGTGAGAMGAFVAVYDALGFRLVQAPFGLSLGAAGLVFLVYPVGTVTSSVSGRLADRLGRRAVLPGAVCVSVVGLLLTLVSSLPVVVLGLAVMTGGFYAVHGLASGWVPARAHARRVASAQAASLYLCAYYGGAAVFGGLAGSAWVSGGWPLVVGLALALQAAVAVLALALRRVPPVPEAVRL